MMPHVVLLLGVLAAARAETCTRWQTFGEGNINSKEELISNGWTTTANILNDPGHENFPLSSDWLQFFFGGHPGSTTEIVLPLGGDFVRVRYGGYGGATEVEVGGSFVGAATSNLDVTTDADYNDGDTLKLIETGETRTSNIWSIGICCNTNCNYPPGACFHGDGTVLLESGSSKRFSELSLGERIKTSDGRGGFSFSPMLTLPHANNTEPAAFLTLTTETGKKVDMTSDNFIPKCNQEEVTAGELVVGDCLLTVDGKETLVEISSTAKNGVFAAITQGSFIVVDGVVASPFSKGSDPAKPELGYEKYPLELEQKRNRKLTRMSDLQKRLCGLGSA